MFPINWLFLVWTISALNNSVWQCQDLTSTPPSSDSQRCSSGHSAADERRRSGGGSPAPSGHCRSKRTRTWRTDTARTSTVSKRVWEEEEEEGRWWVSGGGHFRSVAGGLSWWILNCWRGSAMGWNNNNDSGTLWVLMSQCNMLISSFPDQPFGVRSFEWSTLWGGKYSFPFKWLFWTFRRDFTVKPNGEGIW